MNSDTSYSTRINASLFPKFKGQSACVIGEVLTPEASGMSFKIKTSDDIQVVVQLLEPLQEPVAGIVEVQGIVKNDKLISCRHFVQFHHEYTEKFDMKMYDDAVRVLNQKPEWYLHHAKD